MRYMVVAAILMLAACSDSEDKAPPPQHEAVAAASALSEAAAADPDASDPPLKGAERGPDAGGAVIPAAIRGRWALDPADCPRRPGTDLTALTIDAANLRFHESHGELARVRESDTRRIVADYRFSGEGVEWDRLIVLDAQDGGKILIRRDHGEGAAAGPMRYTRCA